VKSIHTLLQRRSGIFATVPGQDSENASHAAQVASAIGESLGCGTEVSAHLQDIANPAWSEAAGAGSYRQLVSVIAREAQDKIHEFDMQGIANISWSFASLSIVNKPLLTAIAEAAISRLQQDRVSNGQLYGQAISNLLWA